MIEIRWSLGILIFVLGCCVGSFLNVLALRSLKEQSIMWPASYCPQCDHSLAIWDNIPIISFLILGGKCRYCAKPISFQYPLVEFLTGLSYAALAYVFLFNPIPLDGFVSDNRLVVGPHETHDLLQAIKWGIDNHHSSLTLDSPDLAFYKWGLFGGMLTFASTLITVTVTDLREKLIPHEITYPAMLIGIAFSAIVRQDLLGTMAGIGASYIIFDFLAFYGLKIYMMTHGAEESVEDAPANIAAEAAAVQARGAELLSATELVIVTEPAVAAQTEVAAEPAATAGSAAVAGPITTERPTTTVEPEVADVSAASIPASVSLSATALEPAVAAQPDGESAAEEPVSDEPIEVMGGGDAVLSAVMAAYLGWKLLVPSLVIGFLAGTIVGLVLLGIEMKRAGLINECGKSAGKFALILAAVMGCLALAMLYALSAIAGEAGVPPQTMIGTVFNLALLGAAGGALLGMVKVGTRVSKPFPFGPALALGGFVAMFLIPYWLPYY